MWFWIAQIFGGVALILLCFSFQQNNKKILLKYQILSSLFYALQYLFLNAFSGCFMNVACVFRNFIFRRYESRRPPVYYLLIVVGVMLLLSYFSYQGWISLLPVIAVISYSIALWIGNLKVVRIVETFSCFLYIIYNIYVFAITGLISTVIELVMTVVAIYRFDVRKKVVRGI